jgi:hypothetical protein
VSLGYGPSDGRHADGRRVGGSPPTGLYVRFRAAGPEPNVTWAPRVSMRRAVRLTCTRGAAMGPTTEASAGISNDRWPPHGGLLDVPRAPEWRYD